jgi:GNAT superfamily N-acetyltransferase
MQVSVHRIDATRRRDFYELHSEKNGHAWCFCVAWWVDGFDGWGERSAADNRALREATFDRGDYDGYLLYADGEPAGWCQCAPLDRLEHLRSRYDLAPDPNVWAISCFFIAPAFRGRGLARRLLADVIADLRERKIAEVQAFPLRGKDLPVEDLWKGPEALLRELGFAILRDDERLPVYHLTLV